MEVEVVPGTVYDVAVIGAGPAGVQAAVSASDQMRHVLVIHGETPAADGDERTGRNLSGLRTSLFSRRGYRSQFNEGAA